MFLFKSILAKVICVAIIFIVGHLTGVIDMSGNNHIGIFLFSFVTTFTYDLFLIINPKE